MRKPTKQGVTMAASLAAMLAMAGLARADGGDYLLPASYTEGDAQFESRDAEPVSCAAMRETAWFLSELQKSDGQVQPEVPAVRCAIERYAGSTIDVD